MDRAQWTVSLRGLAQPIRAHIGADLKPSVNVTGIRLVSLSGINLNARNLAALELPAKLLGKARWQAGDEIELASTFLSHCGAYRTEWRGKYRLR